jgi:hypothetical protein
VIATIIAWFIGGFVLSPTPDPFSALVDGGIGAFLCAVPLLILGRFAFVKTAAKPVHTLVCSLVCLVAVLSLMCYTLTLRVRYQQRRIDEQAKMSQQASRVAATDLASIER